MIRKTSEQRAAAVNRVPGHIVRWEYKLSAGKLRRRRSAVVYGVTGVQGGISSDPALTLAYKIRHALRSHHPIPPAIIYDADGRVIATMDAMTRQRTTVRP